MENPLFGGVVQLVLIGAAEAVLDAVVAPQLLHGHQEVVAERLGVLHARHHVHDQLGVGLPLRRAERHREVAHGAEDGHQGLDGVAVHHRLILFIVFGGEAGLVDDSKKADNELEKWR